MNNLWIRGTGGLGINLAVNLVINDSLLEIRMSRRGIGNSINITILLKAIILKHKDRAEIQIFHFKGTIQVVVLRKIPAIKMKGIAFPTKNNNSRDPSSIRPTLTWATTRGGKT